MISVRADPYCELTRWILDRRRIPYVEDCHAPVFHLLATRRYGGRDVPVLDTGETALLNAREIVQYYEARARLDQRFNPIDAEARIEAKELVDLFYDKFGVSVRALICYASGASQSLPGLSVCLVGNGWVFSFFTLCWQMLCGVNSR